uniref:Uncharacterized protein n=1 Tax=Romanomermis culicivorax TaxID=13658 RepID=A0A915IY54_ROMCU
MDINIDITTQVKADQEMEEEARCTELTSQDLYGQETTTPRGELAESRIQLTQPKQKQQKTPKTPKKLQRSLWKKPTPSDSSQCSTCPGKN